ncbi:hypothetical protein LIA77_06529 [Sarocladium implicatum]|nr:hypothetical protein LIA77_06529 [Sarocladium implicatum]
MDFIKKAVGDASGSGKKDAKTDGKSGESQDYGDKAFDAISKKAGHDFDPKTDEQITDGARGLYEKATGSKVDSKYSN